MVDGMTAAADTLRQLLSAKGESVRLGLPAQYWSWPSSCGKALSWKRACKRWKRRLPDAGRTRHEHPCPARPARKGSDGKELRSQAHRGHIEDMTDAELPSAKKSRLQAAGLGGIDRAPGNSARLCVPFPPNAIK
jgi:hypothetical protein